MVDVQLLQDTQRESGVTVTAMCRKAGMTKQNYYQKLKNTRNFTQSNISGIKKALHLSDDDIVRIFFADEVV